MKQFGWLLIFLIVGFLFVALGIIFSYLLRERNPNPTKSSTYECGMEPVGSAWIQFNVRYYIVALIFVIFDVEAIFLIPWAVVFKELGFVAFIEMGIFLLILILGLIYAWKKKALEWV